MQFNRNEYLDGNFDQNNKDERINAYNAHSKMGLDWNNYIKDYLKKCLGDAIGTFDYPWQLVQPFANLGPFIEFGLFNQAADYLDTLQSDDVGFNANKKLWSERLRSADDYSYQKSINPNYKTYTIEQMIKDGTINNYLALTGKKLEDLADNSEETDGTGTLSNIDYKKASENLEKLSKKNS